MTDAAIRTITASDGYTIHFRHWPASETQSHRPRGIVIATHGIQSHSGWYNFSSAALAAAGFEVYFADRRGSGLNAQDRGHADHGLRLINDLRDLVRLALSEHPASAVRAMQSAAPGIPLTVMGISWGGKIAAAAAAEFPEDIHRLALLYPGLEPRLRPNVFQRFQLRAARDFDVRRKVVPIPLRDPSLFTDDQHWQEFIRADPLALHEVTSGFLNAGRDLDRILQRQGGRVTQPTLLMLAGRDQIIDNSKTRARVATFACRHLTTAEYPESCHTLEFDRHRDRFVSELIAWLNMPVDSGPC